MRAFIFDPQHIIFFFFFFIIIILGMLTAIYEEYVSVDFGWDASQLWSLAYQITGGEELSVLNSPAEDILMWLYIFGIMSVDIMGISAHPFFKLLKFSGIKAE